METVTEGLKGVPRKRGKRTRYEYPGGPARCSCGRLKKHCPGAGVGQGGRCGCGDMRGLCGTNKRGA